MADVFDALNGLVATIAQAIYPNGTGAPSASGLPTIVYPGWPQSSQLDADLAGFKTGTGRIHVTVFASGSEKRLPAYSTAWQTLSINDATLSLVIAGQAVTVGGSVSTPQNAALLVNGLPYTYAVQAGDTTTSIATALAVQVPGASNVGPVITMPATARIGAARAGGSGQFIREVRRQLRTVQITIWADTPDHRKATLDAMDPVLAGLEFITLSDGTDGRMLYQSSRPDDGTQRANCYRIDMLYTVEYATTQTMNATTIVVAQENLNTGVSGSNQTTTTKTFYQ